MKKKLLSLLLALCLMLTLLPFGASASAQAIRQTYVNPVYADVLSERDLVSGRGQLRAAAAASQTPEEAAAALREQLKNRAETISISVHIPSRDDEVGQTVYDLAIEHTRVPAEGDSLKWVVGGWEMSGSLYSDRTGWNYDLTYTVTYYTTAEQEQELTAAVDQALNSMALAGKGREETVRTIYAYVCDHVTYDYDNLNDGSYLLKYTAYAALVNGTAVCQGYAALLYRLMLEAGIDCRMVSGASHGENHGWNIVQMGARWFFMDSTWDAGTTAHDYELKGLQTFSPDHQLDEEYRTDAFFADYPVGNADYTACGVCGENLVWTLDSEGLLTIGGEGEMNPEPELSNVRPSDYSWNRYKNDVKQVLIDDGVTSIGETAFSHYSNLTAVHAGERVASIGNRAFEYCGALKSAQFRESLRSIGDYVFCNCEKLESMPLPNGLTSIGNWAFDTCRMLSNVVLPETLVTIGAHAFDTCGYEIKSIRIPESVTGIGSYAFSNCYGLETAELPTNLHGIPEGLFCNCGQLRSVTIPENVKSVQYWAFGGCDLLSDVFYSGTAAQWNAVSIAGNNEPLRKATIHAVEPELTILTQPQDVVGKVGDTATFSVEAEGDGLTYQWQYLDPGADWKNSSFTTPTMSCKLTAARSGRQYRCVITDAYEKTVTSEAAMITVKVLTITRQPQDFEGAVGQTATLSVAATGDGLKYQWQYKDPGGSWANSSFKTAAMSCKLTAARDGRQYRCVITDDYGNRVTSAVATIRVRGGITITQQPQDFTGKIGDTATFNVAASGEGLKYQWQYKDPGGAWANSSFKTAAMSCKLTAARDGRQYRCVITDVYGGKVCSAAATIHVRMIVITQQPQDFTGKVGDTAVFTVAATGDGLTYRWQYKDVGGTWANSSFKTPSMSCKITAARDGRQYRCVITDAFGGRAYSDAATIRVG